MDQQQNIGGDFETGAGEPKDQKPALCSDDGGPSVDDFCSSSTSSTATENAEVRPAVAFSAETSPLVEAASSTDISRRVSARCKREETEPTDRKLLP